MVFANQSLFAATAKSSAQSTILHSGSASHNASLQQCLNSIGLILPPCITPFLIGMEVSYPIVILCSRQRSFTKLIAVSLTPYVLTKLFIMFLCGTLSKAAFKSNNIVFLVILWFYINYLIADVVERPGVKPCCCFKLSLQMKSIVSIQTIF